MKARRSLLWMVMGVWSLSTLSAAKAGLAAVARAPEPAADLGTAPAAAASDDDDEGNDGSAPAASIDSLLLRVSRLVPGFGGLFIGEDKGLKIYLVDTGRAPLAKAAIAAVFGRDRFPLDTAQVLKARYEFRRLKAWNDLHRLTTLAIPGVVLTGIDKVNNRLRIGVASNDVIEPVRQHLASLHIPKEAVAIAVVEPIELWTTLTDRVRPLVGGVLITSPDLGCTLGFLAVRQAQAGFVTAGHCSSPGTDWNQPSVKGGLNWIAFDRANPPWVAGPNCPSGRVCRISDTAFLARISDASQSIHLATASFGDIAFPSGLAIIGTFRITGRVNPVDGEQVAKVGTVTGFTEGFVTGTCVDFVVLETNQALLCQDLVTVNGLPGMPGDSGSVAFAETGVASEPPLIEQVHLAGIVNGGNSSLFAFSPMSSIEQDLGSLRTFLGEPGANSPPEVKILTPLDKTFVGVGGLNSVSFTADVVDYEGCCQDMVWTSDVDGVIGHGLAIDFTFPFAGTRKITVTATDNDGGIGSDSITLTALLQAPKVSIDVPAVPGFQVYLGVPFVFKGSSFDPNEPFLSMPCSALTWSSSNPADPFPVNGCTPQVTFQSLGTRTITLKGIDSFGLSAGTSTSVEVVDQPSSFPVVAILNPLAGDFVDAYTPITLKGLVQNLTDPSPITYGWWLFDGTSSTLLGTGMVVTTGQPTLQWKPSDNMQFNCGGRQVTIALEAKSATSGPNARMVQIFVSFPTC